ncbi:MAG: protein-methionine-sulfoxide reductase catalytic subunit MsrP [Alphaproteobacteria bacterium]|nr:protein-methionine-sulfoxide reductase catalytic subunit MsrP [Alphaproteobacteria bacterium]
MLTRTLRGWELPERAVTPERIYHDRRRLLAGMAAGPLLAAAGPLFSAAPAYAADTLAGRLPGPRNETYKVDRALTPEKDATTYNNFYEFGSHKEIWPAAQKLKRRPWMVKLAGMVEKEKTLDIDDLLAKVQIEERVYRHRCVEAWAMTVPWSGFPMKALVDIARPLLGAKYVRMETLADKDQMPGLRQFWYPWPYVEGVTMAEATNDLAFMVVGLYGKPLPPQNGAPLRLALPWKYGFKSTKSIVRLTFTDQRPISFWEKLQDAEYGFWANVNPKVDHPRWSQATEWVLGKDRNNRVPTLLFNGYAEFVADLYKGIEGEKLYM